jgi:hypothetical protein
MIHRRKAEYVQERGLNETCFELGELCVPIVMSSAVSVVE